MNRRRPFQGLRGVGMHQALLRQVGTNVGSGTIVAPTMPWTPFAWYSAQNVNKSGNTGIADSSNLASWSNLGSVGTGADLARQAGNCLFKKVVAAGKMGNLSGVFFDGTGWMASPLFAARATNWVLAMVVMVPVPTTGFFGWCDGAASGATRGGLFTTSSTEHINMVGSGTADSGLAITTAAFATVTAFFNAGATCFVRRNATQSGNVNPGIAGGLTGVTLGALSTGAFLAQMNILEYVASDTPADLTNLTGIEAWAASTYGATPQ